MLCKLKEKCKETAREIFDESQGNKLELEYYLLISETEDCENNAILKTYGIEIVKKANGLLSESKGFENVHTDKERMRDIIGIMAENTVTPVSLQDILEDLLGA
jgi:hypothetical protein